MISFKPLTTTVLAATNDIVGTLEAPQGIASEVSQTNSLLRTVFIFLITLAGLYAFTQFVLGGFAIITAGGDSAKSEKAQKQITNAIIGLVVIGVSFILAAIAGQLLFDNPGFIFNPQLESVSPAINSGGR